MTEEKTQKCTGPSGGFSRSSNPKKTNKQKKVPQRGLGVAQLEKIRLEEQQKKAVSVLTSPTRPASNSLSSPTKSSPNVPNPVPIRHYYSQSNNQSIPFPSLDLPSANSFFRRPNVDVVRKAIGLSSVPLHNNNGAAHSGVEIPGHGNVVVPNLWNANCEYNGADLNKESSSGVLDPGFAFRPCLNNLPNFDQSNPIWPLPNFTQTTQQLQHQPPPPPPAPAPSPSLANVSSANSLSSSSSVLNFHTEPPSNQSYYSNYNTPMWSEEERIVGMKRPYPFSQDNASAPSINFKFPAFVAPHMRTDETTSCGNRGSTHNLDPASNSIFREGPTCSTSISESNSKIRTKQNGSVNGDFLTLAPPTSARRCSSPKFYFPPAYLTFHNPEVPDFDSFPYQGNSGDKVIQRGPSGSNPQQAFYTFIPPAKAKLVRAATTLNSCNVGESVDLNLKL